ncbi:MAG: hypothetical protein Q8891_14725 [Bacteroidota bacterium]|nr:hypothetical protein [Bacteroidota bacterium]
MEERRVGGRAQRRRIHKSKINLCTRNIPAGFFMEGKPGIANDGNSLHSLKIRRPDGNPAPFFYPISYEKPNQKYKRRRDDSMTTISIYTDCYSKKTKIGFLHAGRITGIITANPS